MSDIYPEGSYEVLEIPEAVRECPGMYFFAPMSLYLGMVHVALHDVWREVEAGRCGRVRIAIHGDGHFCIEDDGRAIASSVQELNAIDVHGKVRPDNYCASLRHPNATVEPSDVHYSGFCPSVRCISAVAAISVAVCQGATELVRNLEPGSRSRERPSSATHGLPNRTSVVPDPTLFSQPDDDALRWFRGWLLLRAALCPGLRIELAAPDCAAPELFHCPNGISDYLAVRVREFGDEPGAPLCVRRGTSDSEFELCIAKGRRSRVFDVIVNGKLLRDRIDGKGRGLYPLSKERMRNALRKLAKQASAPSWPVNFVLRIRMPPKKVVWLGSCKDSGVGNPELKAAVEQVLFEDLLKALRP